MAVNLSRHGSTLVVEIDRPERRNALDGATMAAIGTAFTDAETDDEVRAVILTGAGDRAFCAGLDLKATPEERALPPGTPGVGVFTTRCYPKPVIAAVNGAAAGGGFELMIASDLAVVADHATFAIPEVKRGLVGAGCTTFTAMRVTPAIAFELCCIGDSFGPERALALGLVNAVVPAAEVLPTALEYAARVTANAPLAVAVTKQLIWDENRMHDAAEWAVIRAKAAPVFASDDAREGALAFAERRAPVWTGR
jgi:enoyl-CoA hydratase